MCGCYYVNDLQLQLSDPCQAIRPPRQRFLCYRIRYEHSHFISLRLIALIVLSNKETFK